MAAVDESKLGNGAEMSWADPGDHSESLGINPLTLTTLPSQRERECRDTTDVSNEIVSETARGRYSPASTCNYRHRCSRVDIPRLELDNPGEAPEFALQHTPWPGA